MILSACIRCSSSSSRKLNDLSSRVSLATGCSWIATGDAARRQCSAGGGASAASWIRWARMESETLPSLRVLVVDDEPEIRELVGEYLSARGHQPFLTEDGQLAL